MGGIKNLVLPNFRLYSINKCSSAVTISCFVSIDKADVEDSGVDATASHCLLLPGKKLELTPLLNAKKFRSWGNKEGAVNTFRKLAAVGLGTMEEITG